MKKPTDLALFGDGPGAGKGKNMSIVTQKRARPTTADTVHVSDLLHELALLLIEMASAPPRGLILASVRGYSGFDELVADLPEARRL